MSKLKFATERDLVRAWVEKYDKNLLAHDTRFEQTVWIQHGDGSVMVLSRAFIVNYSLHPNTTGWIIAFCEHGGPHIWHHEDLRRYALLSSVAVETIIGE